MAYSYIDSPRCADAYGRFSASVELRGAEPDYASDLVENGAAVASFKVSIPGNVTERDALLFARSEIRCGNRTDLFPLSVWEQPIPQYRVNVTTENNVTRSDMYFVHGFAVREGFKLCYAAANVIRRNASCTGDDCFCALSGRIDDTPVQVLTKDEFFQKKSNTIAENQSLLVTSLLEEQRISNEKSLGIQSEAARWNLIATVIAALLAAILGGVATYRAQVIIEERKREEQLNQALYRPLHFDLENRVQGMIQRYQSFQDENWGKLRSQGLLLQLEKNLRNDVEDFFYNDFTLYGAHNNYLQEAAKRLASQSNVSNEPPANLAHVIDAAIRVTYAKEWLEKSRPAFYKYLKTVSDEQCEQHFQMNTVDFIKKLKADPKVIEANIEIERVIRNGKALLSKLESRHSTQTRAKQNSGGKPSELVTEAIRHPWFNIIAASMFGAAFGFTLDRAFPHEGAINYTDVGLYLSVLGAAVLILIGVYLFVADKTTDIVNAAGNWLEHALASLRGRN
ncbi:hypothetical protein HY095_05555 [Candidatus Micrarchaeota archaeon]|nr:hypothetical protein [Candidatus Micrarchaeota archaeon]